MEKKYCYLKNKIKLFRLLPLLITLCCLVSFSSMFAIEKGTTMLNLTLKDGSSTTYILCGDAKISFENANMCFSSRDWKFEIPLKDLYKWTYNSPMASIDNPDINNISITQSGNVITISGINRNTNIAVYAIDGKLIKNINSSDTTYDIPTEEWGAGVYLMKIGSSTFKILKR